MIKIKLMNYDASEYKMLEEDLNLLANKGYTCSSVDLLTFFKKDSKKAHYITDIFCPKESTQFAKRKEKDEWLASYIDYGYYTIGKIRNVYIFKGGSNNPKYKKTPTNLVLTYFKGLRTILKMILLLLALSLCIYLIPSVFSNTDIYQFVTNGSILIHYTPIVICFTLLFRAFINYYNTNQIKRKLKNKEAPILTNQDKYRKFRLAYIYLLITSSLLLLLGVALDSLERKERPLDPNKILTLEDFKIAGNTKEYNTYTTSSSILIPNSYTYLEQSGTLNIKEGEYGNLLSIKYYELKDETTATTFMDSIVTKHSTDTSSTIKPFGNQGSVYLTYSTVDNIADTMVIKDKQTILMISTSFDLSLPEHQKVIFDFYQK